MSHAIRFLVLTLAFACPLFAQDDPGEPTTRDKLVVNTLLKLDKVDFAEKPAAKQSALRVLYAERGTERYLELAEKFQLPETAPELVRLAVANADKSLGVGAIKLALKLGRNDLLRETVAGTDDEAAKLLSVMALAADPRGDEFALPLVTNKERAVAVRAAAVAVLAKHKAGAEKLLKIIEDKQLPDDLQFAAANGLLNSDIETIRTSAAKHLKLPETADAKPLPAIPELAKRSGDAERGKALFNGIASCAKCHKVRGEGKDVGPDLSEIGTKLSKEAMYLSILDPSAGISFNYESYTLLRDDDTVVTGILVSVTDAEVLIKTADAIVIKVPKAEIEGLKKLTTSLMPAGLQRQLTADNLVDLVEYLTTLKKVGG